MLGIIVFCIIFVTSYGNALDFNGPFVIWGPPIVEDIKPPALGFVPDEQMLALYGKMNDIYIFSLDEAARTDNQSILSNMKDAIGNGHMTYLTQSKIPHPQESSAVVHEFDSSNGYRMQDEEPIPIEKLKSLVESENNVMVILASLSDKERKKREAEDVVPTTVNPTEEPMEEDFIYKADGKVILYTTSAPILSLDSNTSDTRPIIKELKSHGIVTVDEREQFWRLSVTFAVDGGKTTLRFKFPIVAGYWALSSVEVVDKDFNGNLTVVGDVPEAPIGFSHICSRQLVFQTGLTNLTLANVQVQPMLAGASQFSEAIDCIGFTSVPIWSGIFVSFLILGGTFVGIIAIMDIKTPNRFENNRNKQLTFTVQE